VNILNAMLNIKFYYGVCVVELNDACRKKRI